MSEVLHLKYRPKTLDDVIGQDVTVKILKNTILSDKVAHAFLFTGSRGLGKTSLARILAKSVNCNDMVEYNPCNKCVDCIQIDAGEHVDVIEMDAASRTGVDDVRQIIENANYLPVTARFKIYILDEAHMLSGSAFNALLKTLEEPPRGVKFIFATTELRKVPATIVSRCRNFYLTRVPADISVDHMRKVLAKEGLKADDDALRLVAQASGGSVRDALSILEQLMILCKGSGITKKDALTMLGLPKDDVGSSLIDLIARKKCREALELLERSYREGCSVTFLFEYILSEINSRLVSSVESAVARNWCRMWDLALRALDDIRRAPNELHAAYVAVVRMALLSDVGNNDGDVTGDEVAAGEGYDQMTGLIGRARAEADVAVVNCFHECVNMHTFKTGFMEIDKKWERKEKCRDIASLLQLWTGQPWVVTIGGDEGSFISYSELKRKKSQNDAREIVESSSVCNNLMKEFNLNLDTDVALT